MKAAKSITFLLRSEQIGEHQTEGGSVANCQKIVFAHEPRDPLSIYQSFGVVATRRSPAGTHTASGAPRQDPVWLIVALTPPPQAISPAGSDKNQTDSLALSGTFARRLAVEIPCYIAHVFCGPL